MKKTIAILLVAVLALGSVFAGVSGSVTASAGYNLDSKEYGFNGLELKSGKFTVELASDSVATEAQEGFYASVKASFALEATIGKDKLGTEGGAISVSDSGKWYKGDFNAAGAGAEDKNTYVSNGDKSVAYNFVVEEAKVGGENWYVSLKGTPDAPSYAKSYLDLDKDGEKDDDVKVAYYGANGIEVGYADYKVGLGLHGEKGNGTSFTLFAETPSFEVAEGLTVSGAATLSHRGELDVDNSKVGKYGAYWTLDNGVPKVAYEKEIKPQNTTHDMSLSGKVAYSSDLLALTVASDVVVKDFKGDSAFDMDINANAKYDFLTVDAYAALKAEVLHAQVAADLAKFEVPASVTVGLLNVLNAESIKLTGAVSTTIDAISAKLSGNYAFKSGAWEIEAEGAYNYQDIATVKASLSYNNKDWLGMSISAESTTIIPGATLAFGWYDAADLLHKNESKKFKKTYYVADGAFDAATMLKADHLDLGVIKASCTISF